MNPIQARYQAALHPVIRFLTSKRYYNAAFYSTLIRHTTSNSVDQCAIKQLDSPEYYAIIEDYLDNMIKQYKNGITHYVTLDVYLDAMRVFLKNNEEEYHTRDKNVYNMMLSYAKRIPNHFFLKSPIVSDSCYSTEEIGKDEEQLREELKERLYELVWDDDSQDDFNVDSQENGSLEN